MPTAAAKPAMWVLRRAGDSRRRFHAALLVGGVVLCGAGLLAYGIVSPEVPFAEAPVTLAREVRADTVVKVVGQVSCDCTKAIDREAVPVGATGRNWNATYEPFEVQDASGTLHIDTTSITRLAVGPSGGDWMKGDRIALYGSVYDQGHGALALRAQMVAKAPDDTLAKHAFWMLALAAVGALAIAYTLTDRVVFGRGRD
jgi:hypothetical protein